MHCRVPASLVALALSGGSCTLALSRMDQPIPVQDSPLLEQILRGPEFEHVMQQADRHRLQIILTQVDQVYGKPRLTHHSFRLRPREYFYPASLVKLPTALLALEKLHDLPAKQEITMNTPYQVLETSCEKASGQTETNRRFTIRDDVMGSLVISDNPAFDRLYSWTGPAYLTETLRQRGYSSIQITHRLGSRCSVIENRTTHPVVFLGPKGNYVQEPIVSDIYHAQCDDSDLVVGYPGDLRSFGQLSDFHWITIAALLPLAVEPQARFQLTDEDNVLLTDALSRMPEDLADSPYGKDKVGSALKFILLGGSRERIPASVRIFSKTGKALGFLSETGLYLDIESGTAFFLSATLYVNYERSGNDVDHHYDDVGLPFLRDLGQRVLAAERARGKDSAKLFSHLWPRTETLTTHGFPGASEN